MPWKCQPKSKINFPTKQKSEKAKGTKKKIKNRTDPNLSKIISKILSTQPSPARKFQKKIKHPTRPDSILSSIHPFIHSSIHLSFNLSHGNISLAAMHNVNQNKNSRIISKLDREPIFWNIGS